MTPKGDGVLCFAGLFVPLSARSCVYVCLVGPLEREGKNACVFCSFIWLSDAPRLIKKRFDRHGKMNRTGFISTIRHAAVAKDHSSSGTAAYSWGSGRRAREELFFWVRKRWRIKWHTCACRWRRSITNRSIGRRAGRRILWYLHFLVRVTMTTTTRPLGFYTEEVYNLETSLSSNEEDYGMLSILNRRTCHILDQTWNHSYYTFRRKQYLPFLCKPIGKWMTSDEQSGWSEITLILSVMTKFLHVLEYCFMQVPIKITSQLLKTCGIPLNPCLSTAQ